MFRGLIDGMIRRTVERWRGRLILAVAAVSAGLVLGLILARVAGGPNWLSVGIVLAWLLVGLRVALLVLTRKAERQQGPPTIRSDRSRWHNR